MRRRRTRRPGDLLILVVVMSAAVLGLIGSHDFLSSHLFAPRHLSAPPSAWTMRRAKAVAVPRTIQHAVVAPRPGVRGDADAPVLVLTDPSRPAGDAICNAFLATEGLPTCAATDAANLSPTFPLDPYRVIVLAAGEPLSGPQVSQITSWVRQGGHLIAIRPNDNLDQLLGLDPRVAMLPDGYLKIDTRRAPGAGLEPQTMRYHGVADQHPLAGARAVAMLYSSTVADTAFPAVTTRRVNAGTASAYTFDLAESILLSRNGDPDLIGRRTVSNDSDNTVIRLADRFGDGYLDLSRASIPQADELMHLLTNQILQTLALPRLWYLPSYKPSTHPGGLLRAAVVLTGDDHDTDSQTLTRFAAEVAAGPPGCSPIEWTCIRSTSYAYPKSFSDAAAKPYTAQGFEVSPHFSDDAQCTQAGSQHQLNAIAARDLAEWKKAYPSISAAYPPITERWHCYGDWRFDTGPAQADAATGIRNDLSTACWPAPVFDVSQCLLTGSQLPMPYADKDGHLSPVNEFTTIVTDENENISSGPAIAQLIQNAIGPKQYFGYLTMLAHLDDHPESNQMADDVTRLATQADIPIVSARQAAQFWAGRTATQVSAVRTGPTALTFTVSNPVHNLELMVPTQNGTRLLFSIDRVVSTDQAASTDQGSLPVPYTIQTLNGVEYALLPAATAGDYSANYAAP